MPLATRSPTPWKAWLSITALGVASLASGAVGAATAIPAGPLVSTDWLAQNLDNPQVRVIEVSVNPGLYERAHVPGAVNFSCHNDLNDKVRRDIVSQQGFEALLSKSGVTPDTTVVLYGDTNNWFAAWGAWVFDIYGVKNVKLLDGGRKKWEAENRPLNNRAPEYASTTYRVSEVNLNLRARLSDALAAAEAGRRAPELGLGGNQEPRLHIPDNSRAHGAHARPELRRAYPPAGGAAVAVSETHGHRPHGGHGHRDRHDHGVDLRRRARIRRP